MAATTIDTLDYSTATLSVTIDLGRGTADGADIGHDLIAAFEEVIAGSGDDHIVAGSTSLSMTGGGGNDTFEFHRPEDQPAMTVRKITDFTVGDRIVAATLMKSATSRKMASKTRSPTCSTTSICRRMATIGRYASDSRKSTATSGRWWMCTTGLTLMNSSPSNFQGIITFTPPLPSAEAIEESGHETLRSQEIRPGSIASCRR